MDYFWFICLRKDLVFLSLQRVVPEILWIRVKRIVKLHNKSNYLINTDLVNIRLLREAEVQKSYKNTSHSNLLYA